MKHILFNSDQAAYFFSTPNTQGWYSSDGRFFGADEKAARYAGCTHAICDCGEIMEKYFTMCAKCREKKADLIYSAKTKIPWNGSVPLYAEAIDKYFYDLEELNLYIRDLKEKDQDFNLSSLRLTICDPIFPNPIFPDNLFNDSIEDIILPIEIDNALKALNEAILSNTTTSHWKPGKFAFDPELILPQNSVNPDTQQSNNNSVFFLSNHKDLSFLEKSFPNKKIVLIPHPYLMPYWTETEVRIYCAPTISKAVKADILIINGDYFFVSLILQARLALGKTTGFIVCEKINTPDATTINGVVSYSQSLKPMGLRWIKPQKDQINDWKRVQLIIDTICKTGLFVGISSCKNGWQVWVANIDDKRSGLKVQAHTLLGAMELLSSQLTMTNGYLK